VSPHLHYFIEIPKHAKSCDVVTLPAFSSVADFQQGTASAPT